MSADKASRFLASSIKNFGGTIKENSSSRWTPATLDASLKNLYPDSATLASKCSLSAYGDEDGFFNDDYIEEEDEDGGEGKAPLTSCHTKTAASVVGGLPLEFFEEAYDPVVGVIHEVSRWGEGDVTERFMAKIEATDTDKDMVLSRLAAMVESKYSELMISIAHLQAIDVDLERARLQSSWSRRKIGSGCQLLLSGPELISGLNRHKDRLILTMDLAKSLLTVLALEYETLVSNITTGDLGRAAECACSIFDCLTNHSYAQFAALAEMEKRIPETILIIRRKTDRALMRLSCRKFAASEYSRIIHAYLMLDHLAESLNVDIQGPSTADSNLDPFGCLEGLSSRIVRFMLEDVDSCLRTAALESIYASGGANFSTTGFGKSMLELEDSPLSVLYMHIPGEMLVPCIIRSCELLADIVHTHYLITQWHTAPFDPRNDDTNHLHRCPIDLDDVPDDNDDDEDEEEGEVQCEEGKSPTHFPSSGQVVKEETRSNIVKAFEANFKKQAESDERDARTKRLQSARLTIAYHNLAQSRWELWNQLEISLVAALNSMQITSWPCAVLDMVKLGEEFCGSGSRLLLGSFPTSQKTDFAPITLHPPWTSMLTEFATIGNPFQSVGSNASNRPGCAIPFDDESDDDDGL